MKALGVIVALFMSQAAFAFPAVGDYVRYAGEIKLANGMQIPLVAEIELTAYDAGKKEYTVKSTTNVGGQVETVSEPTAEGNILARAAIQNLIQNCKASGGQTSKATVPAGNFDVCMVGQSDGQMHTVFSIGDVPWGIVKSESFSSDGASSEFSLQEVRLGK